MRAHTIFHVHRHKTTDKKYILQSHTSKSRNCVHRHKCPLSSALFLIWCLLLCIFTVFQNMPAEAATSTATKKTPLSKINTIITENEEEISILIVRQNQLYTECLEVINNALENNLLVNEHDFESLQKLSDNLEKRTEKLKAAKAEQQNIQHKLDKMTNTKSSKYRKRKLKIITLQNRQFKLLSQLNKDTEKILELCTPKEDIPDGETAEQ